VSSSKGVNFANVTSDFTSFGCLSCHHHASGVNNPANNSGSAPQWDDTTGADGTTLYQRVLQRVDLNPSTNSLLLPNPSDTTNDINTNGHGGGCIGGVQRQRFHP
jgi:hypothetical protein